LNTGRTGETAPPPNSSTDTENPKDLEGEKSDEGSNPGCPDPSSNARMASSDNCGPCDDDVIACIKTAPGSCEYNILRTYPVSDDGCSCLFDEAPISVEKIPTENETDACGNCVPIGTEPEDLDNDKVADCNDPCIGTVNKCGKCIALGQTDTDVDKDGTPDECDPCINGVKPDGTVPNCSSHREDACHYYTDYYKIDQANCSCTQIIDHTDITDKYSFTDVNGDCCDNPIDYYLNADGDNEGGSTYLGRFCTPPPNSSTTNTDQCDSLHGVYIKEEYFEDMDGDKVGGASLGFHCKQPVGSVLTSGDCDDSEENITTAYDGSVKVMFLNPKTTLFQDVSTIASAGFCPGDVISFKAVLTKKLNDNNKVVWSKGYKGLNVNIKYEPFAKHEVLICGQKVAEFTLILPVLIVDKNRMVAQELKIAKMGPSLTTSGVLTIDKDEDRFFIKVPCLANGSSSISKVSIKLSTSNESESYDDDATEIELKKSANFFITESLLRKPTVLGVLY